MLRTEPYACWARAVVKVMRIPGKSHFVRCENEFEIPESLCTLCLHTIVARDTATLERAEDQHTCSISHYVIPTLRLA